MLPHLEVGHLPSSSSFYSAVVQPLGLRYLSAEDGHFPCITFGDARAGRALFEIRQITAGRERPIVPSHLVVSAPSAEAAEDSYTFAVRANPPEPRDSTRRRPSVSWPAPSTTSATRTLGGGGRLRIRIVDFDGNTMDIVYRPPPDYPPSYGGPTVRRTQSTNKEASRILDWNYDVASSDLRPVISTDSRSGTGSTRTASRRPYDGAAAAADKEPYHTLRRSVTDNGSLYDPTPSPRQNSSGGLSATTIAGALLGAAALGGALTYGMVKSDRSHAPRQNFDSPPSFSRRSTFPDPYPDQRKGSRYVEVERAVEKVRYPEVEYSTVAPGRRSPPEYVAHYSRGSRDDAESRGRRPESQSRSSSSRRRSEAGSYRQPLPLLLHDAPEHRSQASSSSRHQHPPIVKRSYTYELPADGWASSSVRSQSTARPPPPPQVVSRSRSGSRVTTATIKGADQGEYLVCVGEGYRPAG
ncbi:hypothetical protein B0T18DRAFT_126234 [Schizothecium vesticola]|uniref:VOC domain-containing protein n=1 Tax=Schizothecium vesticola TaxID=314040 RepID=A0AA40F3M2_9PEZI|nr:hypothetical protein B0T18DRAFT_126234 [Schizothecium vesticola]